MAASSPRNPPPLPGAENQDPLSEMADEDSDEGEDIFVGNITSYIRRKSESVRNTPSTEPLPPQAQPPCQAEHQHPDPEGSYQGSTATDDEPSASGSYCSAGQPLTAHVRPTHPLKSFAVPANPAAIFESPALPSTPLLTQTGPQLHSVKTASIGTLGRVRPPMPVTVPGAPDVPETSKMLEDVDSSYEPDELTEEMAHLEDLMKDLNAITTA